MPRAFAAEAVFTPPIPYVPDRGEYRGQTRWVGAQVYPVKDDAGRVEEVVLVHLDVTERKFAEAAMARDAMMLAHVRDSVILTDLAGTVTFWNEGATRLFGWAADEMLGRPYADRLPEEARGEVTGWIGRIAAGAAEFAGEWLDWRRDGSRGWIAAHNPRGTRAAGG